MTLTSLFLTFFRIGLFTIGGGLASLPLLKEAVVDSGLLALTDFIDMVAISQSTPGPIGINIATFVGYRLAGIPGGIVATAGISAPSLVIILLIARWMRSYANHPIVENVLQGIRACALGLIASAAWFILHEAVFSGATGELGSLAKSLDVRSLVLFVVLAAAYRIKPAWPVLYIAAGGILGAVFL